MIRPNALSAAVLAGVAVLALGGCSRSTSSAEPSQAATLSEGPATGSLTVWAQGTEGEALPELLKGFEADNPDVEVNVTAVPWDSALSKYQTAIAGGSGPDVGMFGSDWMPGFRTTLQQVPESIDTSGFFPTSVDVATLDGRRLGVPWSVDTRVVYYRTDLATQAGYSAVPSDWEGFRAFAKALQDKAGAQYGIGLATSGTNSFLNNLPFVWSAGGNVIDDDQTTWTLDSPQVLEAMTYYESFFEQGIANPTPSTAAGSTEADFVDGSVPMFISGPWEIGSLAEAGGDGFEEKYGVARIPENASSTSFLGGSVLSVPTTSDNPQAAWKLVQYLSEPSTQVEWYELTGDLPARQDAWQDDALAADPKVSVFGEQLESAQIPPTIAAWNQVSAAADLAQEQIVSGTAPATALAELQAKAESIGTGE